MKIQTRRSAASTDLTRCRERGFALIVTLSLMILLTVIAVGLLSLSSISLRATGQSESMSTARANAKLALMLALGDLQKTTGPDRAITAPASIIDAAKPSGVTGVWSPWSSGSSPESRTKTARDANFKQWLLSTTDGKNASISGTPPLVAFGVKDSVTLLGDGALGKRAAEKGDDQRINLATTQVINAKSNGRFAWAVIDESTKARIDLYEKDPTSVAAAVLRAGAPPVDGIRALGGLDKLTPGANDSSRMISMSTAGLVNGSDSEKLKVYNPDLTVHSSSLLTDVVSGGLKKDLSIWFSRGLTAAEKSARLYRDSKTVTTAYPSDPQLALLESYHQYYKNIDKKVGTLTPQQGGVAAKLPDNYVSASAGVVTPVSPSEPLMVPTVLRVDVIFSLIARDAHGGRATAARPYLLHLLYLPVITLHNPYNVPMSVEGLKVTFKNLPIGFNFTVNGQQVLKELVPLNKMFLSSNQNTTKDFSCNLGSAITNAGSSPFILKAGQTKLFGTPKVPPTWTWNDESAGAGADGVALFDWRNNQTSDFQMAPKLMTAPTSGAGFDIDYISPSALQTPAGVAVAGGESLVGLKPTDSVGVIYGPYAPSAGNGSFDIKIELKQSGKFYDAGAFSIKYADANQLKKIVEQGTSVRFPTARSFPETYPKSPGDPPIRASDIYEAGSTQIRNYLAPKPFVIFSVGTRTTKESFVPTRTIADGNPVMNLAKIDLSNNKDPIGGVPLEMVMMPIRNGNAAIEELRATEEGYSFGGNGALTGSPRATFYEVPRAPLQSLAQFRNANLSGSGFMPMMTYTVGESRAHPQIGTDQIISSWTDGSKMLDHTWLANEALWDRYFLSTVADQTVTQFASAKSYTSVMTDFFAMTSRLPNQRFTPYNPGSTAIPKAVQNSSTPQDVIAASLLLQGGFNVNSTSEDAWVAVLSGLREASIETDGGLDPGKDKSSAFPRVRRPVGKNIDAQAINSRVTNWEGYRSLSDADIRNLAAEVVKEVRKRGPFLSIADFVNRRVGAQEDEINVKGALQASIDRLTSLNQVANADGIELTEPLIASHGYKSTKAALGNNAAGAPASLSQGDILTSLGSRITVRSDTFRIRAYGEARDASGKTILAKVWCEAVVQRLPEYVNPNDAATVVQPPLAPGAVGTPNQTFGRRYEIQSFRWLAPAEV